MSLLVSGTVAFDSIKTPAGRRENILGGSAVHFCMSASFFEKVHLVGIVGKDFSKTYFHLLRKKNIDVSSLQQKEGKTFSWRGEYKKNNLSSAITHKTHLGVLQSFHPVLTEQQKRIPYVFLANDDPLIQMRVLQQLKRPKFVGLDSMNLWIDIRKKLLLSLLKKVDLFFVNEGEAKMLTGESQCVKAVKALGRLGPKWIVLKKGEHGIFCQGGKGIFAFPAYPVEEVVDPTGAGDTFAGGLMGYLAKIRKTDFVTMKHACLYAIVLASFNVQGFGIEKTEGLSGFKVRQRLGQFLHLIQPPFSQ